jgi:hypothetical protein
MPRDRKPKKTQYDYRPHHSEENYDVADASAFQALKRGDASPDQQKRALEWIIRVGARIGDMPYFDGPDGERATAFACGKQFVGHAILKLLKLDLALLRQRQDGKSSV